MSRRVSTTCEDIEDRELKKGDLGGVFDDIAWNATYQQGSS